MQNLVNRLISDSYNVVLAIMPSNKEKETSLYFEMRRMFEIIRKTWGTSISGIVFFDN